MKRTILIALCAAAVALAAGGCNKNKKKAADGSNKDAAGMDDESRYGKGPDVKGTEVANGDMRDLLLALKRVHFPYDSSTLSDEARAALSDAAEKLSANPEVELWVDGHTDDRGTTEYNMSLGERRARAVVEYLGRLGVSSRRLGVISYGEEIPLAKGNSTKALARNRRVEYRVMRGNVRLVLEEGSLVDDKGHPL